MNATAPDGHVCRDCKWFNGSECRRFPPTWVSWPSYSSYWPQSSYPMTGPDQWCGEWNAAAAGSLIAVAESAGDPGATPITNTRGDGMIVMNDELKPEPETPVTGALDASPAELAGFALRMVTERMKFRIAAMNERGLDGVSISKGFATEIVNACRRGSALLEHAIRGASRE